MISEVKKKKFSWYSYKTVLFLSQDFFFMQLHIFFLPQEKQYYAEKKKKNRGKGKRKKSH